MNGARIGITGTRRAAEQASLVRSLGGEPVHGPSVDIDVAAPDEEMRGAVDALLSAPIDTAVMVTGVGTRHLAAAAGRLGHGDAMLATLRAARVIARGTKPRRVLRELGVPVAWTAAPPESRIIRDALLDEPLTGRRILVQCAGSAPDLMIGPLRAAGADVIEVHPYALDVPPDGRAAVALAAAAAEGRLDALTFTSAHAVHGFVALAERAGIDIGTVGSAGTLIVAIGPVTRDALIDDGLPVHVEPETPRMGAMFRATAAALARAGHPAVPDR